MLFAMLRRSVMARGGAGRGAALALATLAGLGISAASLGAEPVRPALTPKLQGLLQQEMVQLGLAMQEVHGAIVQGQHAVVAEKGQAIHDSFILAQSLTDQDRQALKSAVPAAFLQMDADLHALSAALADAGRAEDTPRQVELFRRMTEACVACHSAYVSDRFEGLDAAEVPAEWGQPPKAAGDSPEG